MKYIKLNEQVLRPPVVVYSEIFKGFQLCPAFIKLCDIMSWEWWWWGVFVGGGSDTWRCGGQWWHDIGWRCPPAGPWRGDRSGLTASWTARRGRRWRLHGGRWKGAPGKRGRRQRFGWGGRETGRGRVHWATDRDGASGRGDSPAWDGTRHTRTRLRDATVTILCQG